MQECPMCGGPGGVLGALGNVVWLSCRNCGWQFQADGPLESDDDESDEFDPDEDD